VGLRFRCTKVWLRGEKSGQVETFVDNLPGGPDNIRLGSDGSFWIALLPVSRSPCHYCWFVQITHMYRPACKKKKSITSSRVSAFKTMQVRSPWLHFVHRWTLTKRVVASFPALLEWSKATGKGAMVAQVSEDGEIVRLLDDSEGKVVNLVTSVNEYDGDLFLGSLATNFVGKVSLAQVTQQQDAVSIV
jgi:hypothetical protein